MGEQIVRCYGLSRPGPPRGFVVVGEGKRKDVSIETHVALAGLKKGLSRPLPFLSLWLQ